MDDHTTVRRVSCRTKSVVTRAFLLPGAPASAKRPRPATRRPRWSAREPIVGTISLADASTCEERRDQEWRRLVYNLAELSVHSGLMNSVMSQYPPHVGEAFLERLEMLNEHIDRQIKEIQMFGEAYDEEDD